MVVALAVALAGCGGGEPAEVPDADGGGGVGTGTEPGEEPGPGAATAVRLSFRVSDRPGAARTAGLVCGPGRLRATGYLSGDAEAACADARRLGQFLASEPEEDRICTQVYGGPETARVQGSVGGREVDRRLGRADGCEIAEWDRAAALLGEPAG